MSQQSRQELPENNAPLVDEKKMVCWAWLNLFRSLYTKTGGGNSSDGTAVFLQEEPDGTVGAYRAMDGQKLGTVTLT